MISIRSRIEYKVIYTDYAYTRSVKLQYPTSTGRGRSSDKLGVSSTFDYFSSGASACLWQLCDCQAVFPGTTLRVFTG